MWGRNMRWFHSSATNCLVMLQSDPEVKAYLYFNIGLFAIVDGIRLNRTCKLTSLSFFSGSKISIFGAMRKPSSFSFLCGLE